ncbi:MAG: O-acetylhomoserine, partial [Treponema sp.]|nr:O-acetylhomoserine [Treponema sp.]
MTDMRELKKKISAQAESLGLSLIGFAPADRWEEKESPRRSSSPRSIWPWAKTVIVGGVPIFLPMLETTPSNLYSELYNTTNRLL